MKFSNFFALTVFILIFQYEFINSQITVSLEDVYEHTNKNDFAINDLYKVIDRNHSNDGIIEVSIEGSISDPDFSFAIISMLPALKKRHGNLKQVKFKYYYYRDEDLQEALLISAIKELFPDMVLDYLIERAKFEFRNDWKQSINLTPSQIGEVEDLIKKPKIVQKTINEFTSTLYDDFRIQVNGIEIQLLSDFYSDSERPLIQSNCCNLELCVMEGLYRKVDQ